MSIELLGCWWYSPENNQKGTDMFILTLCLSDHIPTVNIEVEDKIKRSPSGIKRKKKPHVSFWITTGCPQKNATCLIYCNLAIKTPKLLSNGSF